MPGPNQQLGAIDRAIAGLQRQIDRLARRLIDLAHLDQSGAADGEVPVWNDTTKAWEPGAVASTAPVLFSAAGVPPSGTYSPPYKVPTATSTIVLNGLLGTAGGSTTSVGVYAGATLLASVSLGSGVIDNSSTTSVSVAASTVVRLLASSVGTGAQDLTVEASFL